jgi:hypothetical protein
MKPDALALSAPPAPAFGENLCDAEASPLAGTGPDLEGSSSPVSGLRNPVSEELPLPVPAPSSFAPVAQNNSDRGAHHYRLISRELVRLEAKIAVLKRFLASSYA